MRVKTVDDKDFVLKMREAIKNNDGYCPCRIEKKAENKCICKEFRDMMEEGKSGKCHCGLYEIVND